MIYKCCIYMILGHVKLISCLAYPALVIKNVARAGYLFQFYHDDAFFSNLFPYIIQLISFSLL